MTKLPKLLEESSRPHKKLLKQFYDYIHQWRYSIYRQWRSLVADDSYSEEQIGNSTDALIGLILLLEHCKRCGYADIKTSSFLEIGRHGTFSDLRRTIADSFSCRFFNRSLIRLQKNRCHFHFRFLRKISNKE